MIDAHFQTPGFLEQQPAMARQKYFSDLN